MGDEKQAKQGILEKIAAKLMKKVQAFVAFEFLIFTAGMVFALIVKDFSPWLLLIPPILGLIAYYSAVFSLLLFAFFIIVFIL
ncbi:MAG: hypothetical protein HYW05_00370 [Candidatus Diapherotrites archaeon]|nr:hypothetical protein [Candidatus Diapherotrites archaeon]